MRKSIIPDSDKHWLELRTKVLTSTDVPVLFNQGYISYSELLENKKSGIIPKFQESNRMSWGKFLESGIANKFAHDNNWEIEPMKQFIFDDITRVGASFDYRIKLSNGKFALMEIKNVSAEAYKRDWIKGFEIQSSPYIELQVATQLMISEYEEAYICACIGGNEGICLKREPNKKIQDAILIKSERFWKEVDNA